jgi:hypothetical protein
MDAGTDAATTRLAQERVQEWLQGEPIYVMALVGQVDGGRFRVRGLDADGHDSARVDRILDAFDDGPRAGAWTVVRGDHPGCAAAVLYQAAIHDHTFLTITPHRVALLRLRDRQDRLEGVADALRPEAGERSSLGGFVRGVGKLLKAGASDMAASIRRPPLGERPDDAVLERPFEAPAHLLHSITPWKPPLMPKLPGGPRWVQVHLNDGSWTCLSTDSPGAAALTCSYDGR